MTRTKVWLTAIALALVACEKSTIPPAVEPSPATSDKPIQFEPQYQEFKDNQGRAIEALDGKFYLRGTRTEVPADQVPEQVKQILKNYKG